MKHVALTFRLYPVFFDLFYSPLVYVLIKCRPKCEQQLTEFFPFFFPLACRWGRTSHWANHVVSTGNWSGNRSSRNKSDPRPEFVTKEKFISNRRADLFILLRCSNPYLVGYCFVFISFSFEWWGRGRRRLFRVPFTPHLPLNIVELRQSDRISRR